MDDKKEGLNIQSMNDRLVTMEAMMHGELGLVTSVKELNKTIKDLHTLVIELKTKDRIQSSLAGAIGGTVGSIILWLIQHFSK